MYTTFESLLEQCRELEGNVLNVYGAGAPLAEVMGLTTKVDRAIKYLQIITITELEGLPLSEAEARLIAYAELQN